MISSASQVDRMIRTLTVITAVILLAACGTPRLPVPDPTPLTEINSSVQVDSRWVSNEVEATSKKTRDFLALRPILVGKRLLAASPEGEVLAFDTESGEIIWKTELGQRLVAGTGADDAITVVVSDSGTVYALDLNDGAKLWEYQLSEVVFAPPLVYLDRVIMRTIDGNLITLSAGSGEFLWDAFYDQPEFLEFGSASPVGFQNLVVIGNALGRVIATEVSTGLDAWQLYLGSERSVGALRSRETPPVIFEDRLVLSDLARAVVTYDLTSGNVMWENRRPAGRNLVIDRSRVYGHNSDSLIYALRQHDGAIDWEQKALLHRGVDGLALVDRYLVVADRLGYLHVLDRSSGEIIGRAEVGERVPSHGLIGTDNSLYLYSRSGRIKVYSFNSTN